MFLTSCRPLGCSGAMNHPASSAVSLRPLASRGGNRLTAVALAIIASMGLGACASRLPVAAQKHLSQGVTLEDLGYRRQDFVNERGIERLNALPQQPLAGESSPVYLVNLTDEMQMVAWKYESAAGGGSNWIAVNPPVGRTCSRQPEDWRLCLADNPRSWRQIGMIPRGITYTIIGRFRIPADKTVADIPTGCGRIDEKRKELVLFVRRPSWAIVPGSRPNQREPGSSPKPVAPKPKPRSLVVSNQRAG